LVEYQKESETQVNSLKETKFLVSWQTGVIFHHLLGKSMVCAAKIAYFTEV